MFEWVIPVSIAYWTYRTVKNTFRFESEKRERKQQELNQFQQMIFAKKIEKNMLEMKLIAYRDEPEYAVYEARSRGYRLVIEERKESVECWMGNPNQRMVYKLNGRQEGKEWIWKETFFTKETAETSLLIQNAQAVKQIIESEEWKKNVNKAHKEYYPEIHQSLMIIKKLDDDLYQMMKRYSKLYIRQYPNRRYMDTPQKEKIFKEIPQKVQSMIKEYNQLNPSYRKLEKENVMEYIEKVSSSYSFKEKEKREDFLTLED